MAVVRWAAIKGCPENSWLGRMLSKKPKKLVAVALANKMARTIWSMTVKGTDYLISGSVIQTIGDKNVIQT